MIRLYFIRISLPTPDNFSLCFDGVWWVGSHFKSLCFFCCETLKWPRNQFLVLFPVFFHRQKSFSRSLFPLGFFSPIFLSTSTFALFFFHGLKIWVNRQMSNFHGNSWCQFYYKLIYPLSKKTDPHLKI